MALSRSSWAAKEVRVVATDITRMQRNGMLFGSVSVTILVMALDGVRVHRDQDQDRCPESLFGKVTSGK
jgi:hypothetical protein